MELSLREAAEALGKSQRQVRYMIQLGKLKATKVNGEWRVKSDELALTPRQKQEQEASKDRVLQIAEEVLRGKDAKRAHYPIDFQI